MPTEHFPTSSAIQHRDTKRRFQNFAGLIHPRDADGGGLLGGEFVKDTEIDPPLIFS
jgi:hypothetical protein